MKIKTALLGLTIAGMTALSISCSGSSDSNESSGGKSSTSTAGKSATAGTSSGGKGGSGGASNNGGTKTNNGGTGNNGGTTSNGGTVANGGFNFGGAGLDPEDLMCNPVPVKGSACAAGTQPCLDDTAVCFCQMAKWACIDLGGGAGGAGPGAGGQLECPATKPMSGADCGDTAGVCPYGQGGCACYNGMWACN